MSEEKVVCLYHADCPDGIGAAYAVAVAYNRKGNQEVIFRAMKYGDKVDDLPIDGNTTLIIVDFSFDLGTMVDLWRDCGRMIFLDHHERSKDIAVYMHGFCVREDHNLAPVDVFQYEEHHSGAVMAWNFFNREYPVPVTLLYIEDRDLWRFELPRSREVTAGLFTYPMNLDSWLDLLSERSPIEMVIKGKTVVVPGKGDNIENLANDGVIALRQIDTQTDLIIKQTLRFVDFPDYPGIPLINCPKFLMSEALDKLNKKYPFAAGYFDDATHREYSLRSHGLDAIRVNDIAAKFGGGGHRRAAGFRLPRDHEWAKL